jgi:hypothetical protein
MSQQDALDILFENTPTDYIMGSYETSDFYEFHVSCGGDICIYKVYKKDGRVHEIY